MGSVDTLTFIEPGAPLADLAEKYLRAMLARERDLAADLVMQAVDRGESLKEIYLRVFQPVQYEVGRLWQHGDISVGHEHYCSNATQLIMSMLYPLLFKGERGGRRLLAACVQGELHEIGLRMLSDFFEMEGWSTTYLGANTPPESVVSAVDETGADLLAVGVTMHFHLEEAERLIRAVRAVQRQKPLPILVGGYTCLTLDSVWQKIGADGTAQDAQQALKEADRLVPKRGEKDE